MDYKFSYMDYTDGVLCGIIHIQKKDGSVVYYMFSYDAEIDDLFQLYKVREAYPSSDLVIHQGLEEALVDYYCDIKFYICEEAKNYR